MDSSPSIIVPQFKSMISDIFSNVLVFVDNFTTGVIGFPVGVPNPVVNKTILAPAATSAVVLSTSFPGVHKRFKPGLLASSG
ncbi:hypothetical protein D3C71_1924120 [compost metagenome]